MPDFSEILPDLFNIEVNTIIKDRMTAEKMPSLPFAFHDILRIYSGKLEDYGVDLSLFFSAAKINEAASLDNEIRAGGEENRAKPSLRDIFTSDLLQPRKGNERFNFGDISNGWITFEIIRLIAGYMRQADTADWRHEKKDPIILERIQRNCDQLTYIIRSLELTENPNPTFSLNRFSKKQKSLVGWDKVLNKTLRDLLKDDLRWRRLPLKTVSTENRILIRKIWEVGVEDVVVQTSIMADGDVVTRLGYELHKGQYAANKEEIMDAHIKSVNVSLKQWNGLVKVAILLVRDVIAGVSGAKKS